MSLFDEDLAKQPVQISDTRRFELVLDYVVDMSQDKIICLGCQSAPLCMMTLQNEIDWFFRGLTYGVTPSYIPKWGYPVLLPNSYNVDVKMNNDYQCELIIQYRLWTETETIERKYNIDIKELIRIC